jgi:hypothetical protein
VSVAGSIARYEAAFGKGLRDTGNVEGQNVMVEYHWLDGPYDRAPTLVGDMARRRVAVIATLGAINVRFPAGSTAPPLRRLHDDPA